MIEETPPILFISGWGCPSEVISPEFFTGNAVIHRMSFDEALLAYKQGRFLGIDGILESLGSSPTIVAWSAGAILALRLAEEFLDEQAKLLLFAGSPQFCLEDPAAELASRENELRAFRASFARDAKATLSAFYQRVGLDTSLEENLDSSAKKELKLGLKYMQEESLLPELAKITAEVLLVHGLGDAVIPSFHSECIQEGVSRSNLLLVEDAGHMPWRQLSTIQQEKVNNFLLRSHF